MSSLEQLIHRTERLCQSAPALRSAFPDFHDLSAADAVDATRRSIYVLGTIKAGKSTLINALLGQDVMPRGSGVKTFNLTRVSDRQERSAAILFKSSYQLAHHFRHDFRLLGFDFNIPSEPYRRESLDVLERLYAQFEAAWRDDDRLGRLERERSLTGLLSVALARVRKTMSGLRELHQRFDPSVVEAIARDGRLAYEGDRFGRFTDWTSSHNLAALILEITMGLPFRPELRGRVEIVDCQGSDSLNPLDFAAVESIIHKTDRILYIVNSRLGLRVADKELLGYLGTAGVANKIALVFNVEAYEPLAITEIERMTQQIAAELRELRADLPIYAVNSLDELMTATENDEAGLVEELWTRRGLSRERIAIKERFKALIQDIAYGDEFSHIPDTSARSLVAKALSTGQALLSRDEQILGVRSIATNAGEAKAAIKRVIDGELKVLEQEFTKRVSELFGTDHPLRRDVRALLDQDPRRYLTDHPVPESLAAASRQASVVDAAIELVNTELGQLEEAIKLRDVIPSTDAAAGVILASVERIERMLPQIVPEAVLTPLAGDAAGPLALVRNARTWLDEIVARTPSPSILDPLVLPPPVRHALAAQFHSRHLWERIRAKIAKAEPRASSERHRIEALWAHTLRAALRQAREDVRFSLTSAAENYKYQYFFLISRQLLDRVAERLGYAIDRHYELIKSHEERGRLLLKPDERKALEEYLRDLATL